MRGCSPLCTHNICCLATERELWLHGIRQPGVGKSIRVLTYPFFRSQSGVSDSGPLRLGLTIDRWLAKHNLASSADESDAARLMQTTLTVGALYLCGVVSECMLRHVDRAAGSRRSMAHLRRRPDISPLLLLSRKYSTTQLERSAGPRPPGLLRKSVLYMPPAYLAWTP